MQLYLSTSKGSKVLQIGLPVLSKPWGLDGTNLQKRQITSQKLKKNHNFKSANKTDTNRLLAVQIPDLDSGTQLVKDKGCKSFTLHIFRNNQEWSLSL